MKNYTSYAWMKPFVIWLMFAFAIVTSYLSAVHFDSDPKVRAVFKAYNLVGMSGPDVESLLGSPVDARTYYEKDGTPRYYWDYTRRGRDRIWLVRRHKVVFDMNGEKVVKVLCYFSDDDDD